MTASTFSKTLAHTGYSSGDNGWRRSLENGGRGGRPIDKRTADAIRNFGKGDTVDHDHDERLKNGTIASVDTCKVYVRWPGRLRDDHYHPGVLVITKKAAAASSKKPKRQAKNK